jgi:hypothetical protein
MLQSFDPEAGAFVSKPIEIMNPGEDPRCIQIGDRPFVLSSNPPGGAFNYALFDIRDRKATNIVVDGAADFVYGKNWQPYVSNGELYVIHEFHPSTGIPVTAADVRRLTLAARLWASGTLTAIRDAMNCSSGRFHLRIKSLPCPSIPMCIC